MPNQACIVEEFCEPLKSESPRRGWFEAPHSSKEIGKEIARTLAVILTDLRKRRHDSFDEVEKRLIQEAYLLGRLFVLYFLTWRHERSGESARGFWWRGFWKGQVQSRQLGTFFGKVRYWRTYARSAKGTGGSYPLDAALELTRDGFSIFLIGLMARLATYLSFDRTTVVLSTFLTWSPSKTTVEKSVLGLGRFTQQWFREAPAPEGDGEVLVIQIDSKAVPTATPEELGKRRGKRKKARYPKSPRHRGRQKRAEYEEKPRKKRGDKSKNGKMATLVAMYTLKPTTNRKGEPYLAGPINKKVYASFAPKEHAFQIARREADKRGFTAESGRTVQVVTDGDLDLETYTKDYFPEAIHTLDIYHAFEYLWTAAGCVHEEGSEELDDYYAVLKVFLSEGKVDKVIVDLEERLDEIPTKGPGNKGRRKRMEQAIGYLSKRRRMMNYDEIYGKDLESSSGAVEGAIKDTIGARFDHGGMRWILERSEALLQLRCIVTNDDWDAFMAFVREKVAAETREHSALVRVLTNEPSPLPKVVGA